MKPVQLKENIYWVGGIDWDIRSFHGYQTPRGTTYKELLPGQSPYAEFPVRQQDVIEVREYCTIHGLWATK